MIELRLAIALPVAGLSLVAGVAVGAWTSGEEEVVASQSGYATAAHQPDIIPPIVADNPDVTIVVETVETELASDAIEKQDRYVPQGIRRVISKGDPGRMSVSYTVTYADGVEVSRTEIARFVLEEPVDDVVAVGTLVVPPRPAVVPGTNRAIGQDLAADYGWTGIEWQCLDNLWERESNWRHLVANPSSGAYGIPQALPANKMATFGADYLTNPATQIAWGLDYISHRYGTPCYAWASWTYRSPHWY